MKRTALLSLCFAGAVLAADQPAAVVVNRDNVYTFYSAFKRLTAQPRTLDGNVAVFCIPPTEAIAKAKQRLGPHFETKVHVYVNAPANDAIARKVAAFPVGAVVVKEKLATDGTVTGVGGMIKRAAGFDAQNGDWEYFYADKPSGFSTGRLENCSACHAQAKDKDYVFSVWKQEGQ